VEAVGARRPDGEAKVDLGKRAYSRRHPDWIVAF
jgi:hypothetical protein